MFSKYICFFRKNNQFCTNDVSASRALWKLVFFPFLTITCFCAEYNDTQSQGTGLLKKVPTAIPVLSSEEALFLSNKLDDISTKIIQFDNVPLKGQIVYNGDLKVDNGHIVNSVVYSDGTIIAARSNGKIVNIDYSGSETILLSLSASNLDWRGMFIDSNENVYASPHATKGVLKLEDRGLYRLTKGDNAFQKSFLFTIRIR